MDRTDHGPGPTRNRPIDLVSEPIHTGRLVRTVTGPSISDRLQVVFFGLADPEPPPGLDLPTRRFRPVNLGRVYMWNVDYWNDALDVSFIRNQIFIENSERLLYRENLRIQKLMLTDSYTSFLNYRFYTYALLLVFLFLTFNILHTLM